MARQRIATAVLLTRGDGDGLEVYLVQRAESLRFFGGYWACPGGVVDPVDHDGEADRTQSHRRCAVRELFEETGVLPAALAGSLDAAQRTRHRAGLLADRTDGWRALLDAHPTALEAASPFARLTTPPFAPVLYRTLFLHVALPAGEQPRIVPGELVDGHFARPADLLQRWIHGEQLIVPPVLWFLHMLCEEPDLAAFLVRAQAEAAQNEAGRLHDVINTPGILMAPLATETLPPATTTNCYVVGSRELYVVDPATPHVAEQERLFALLDARVAAGARLAGILVTHHHADHVGAVAATSARYRLPVHGHPLTLDRLPPGFRRGRQLLDGAVIPLGEAPDGSADWHLVAHHTPGHDRGHLVFVESRYGAALVGDLASTVSTIVIDPPEGHMGTYLESLRHMLDVPFQMLYPAHGPAHRHGHALCRQYLEHRAEREAALLEALGPQARSVPELVAPVYADLDRNLHGLAARSLLAGLEKLAEEGRARKTAKGWYAT